MNDDVYYRLAKVLDTLPNGFPATESGVEIRLLKWIFQPEEAELFCDLKLTFETVAQIAERTGRPQESLEKLLRQMAGHGQIFMIEMGEDRFFKMLPWVFGIYEFQLGRMDREFAAMVEAYWPIYNKSFFTVKPQLMQTLSIEETIPFHQEALPYCTVSKIIEANQSFLVNECVCKKEKGMVDEPCSRPTEVCIAVAPVPGVFDKWPIGRVITKEDAYALLNRCEEEGLVHLTGNMQFGQMYICNCCKCCCGVLRSITELGIPASLVINSQYYAEIDRDKCISCGLCADTRCQVNAISEGDDAYAVNREGCIGCGLCISTCPSEAIRLVCKDAQVLAVPPVTEDEWFEERGRRRGVDFSAYK
ncbi:MAG: 4Fe-4S binding protein [Syntrophaceae bacterium]|jgi:Na+-translocating ferredoxin:NAD+ oxidoreductase subunit B|nr:4Fe-4S binding protein [Syntrophaceae bacterium]HOC59472.1 4Fe-4S binding protein [Smithellaceae bacterium]